jgi:hypothetical protein
MGWLRGAGHAAGKGSATGGSEASDVGDNRPHVTSTGEEDAMATDSGSRAVGEVRPEMLVSPAGSHRSLR